MIKDIQINVGKVQVEYSGPNYKVDVELEEVDVYEVIDQIGVENILDQIGVKKILEQIDRDEIIDFVREDLFCEVKE